MAMGDGNGRAGDQAGHNADQKQKVAEVNSWPWAQRSGGGMAKSGGCPECGHPMSVIVPGPVVLADKIELGLTRVETSPLGTTDRWVTEARCNCKVDHGRGEKETGCGWHGLVAKPIRRKA